MMFEMTSSCEAFTFQFHISFHTVARWIDYGECSQVMQLLLIQKVSPRFISFFSRGTTQLRWLRRRTQPPRRLSRPLQPVATLRAEAVRA